MCVQLIMHSHYYLFLNCDIVILNNKNNQNALFKGSQELCIGHKHTKELRQLTFPSPPAHSFVFSNNKD